MTLHHENDKIKFKLEGNKRPVIIKSNYFFLIIFNPAPIWTNPLYSHLNVDLMAYFIASKCFAAKTGFPNRRSDVVPSGFSKRLIFIITQSIPVALICLVFKWDCFLSRSVFSFTNSDMDAVWTRFVVNHLDVLKIRAARLSSCLWTIVFLIYTRTHFVQFC